MNKIELKHLAPYAPYGLDIFFGGTKRQLTAISLDSHYVFITAWFGSREKQMAGIEGVKPILRPLSDLTKEIEHNGERFVPINEIQNLYPTRMDGVPRICYVELSGQWMLNTNRDGEVSINIMRRIDQMLFKWHFDVFELIAQGLAIDINTLK